jgi:hypothetical protein
MQPGEKSERASEIFVGARIKHESGRVYRKYCIKARINSKNCLTHSCTLSTVFVAQEPGSGLTTPKSFEIRILRSLDIRNV